LFPNQFVNTRLLVNTLVGATLIPTAAIQHNGKVAFVYLLDNNKAHLRPVTVGVTNGDTAQVDGIGPGDVLATSSFDKLQDNATIAIAKQAGQPPVGVALLEPVRDRLFSSGCNVAVDGGDPAGGHCRLFSTARLGAAAGRLSDDSDSDVLPRARAQR